MSIPLVDHLVWVVPDLERACASLADGHGIEAVAGGRHPAHGTRNRLVGLGSSTFLEILSVDPAADPRTRSPRGAMVAATTSARLHEMLLHTDDFDEMLEIVAIDEAIRLTGVFPGQRERADGSRVEWRRAELRTAAGAPVPDVIDWITSHPTSSLPHSGSLTALSLTAPDASSLRTALDVVGDTTGMVLTDGAAALEARIDTPRGQLTLRG